MSNRVVFLFLSSLLLPITSVGQQTPSSLHSTNVHSSIARHLGTQNLLFKEQFEDDLRESPETATAYGDYRNNGRLDDYSLADSVHQNQINRAYRKKLQAISTDGFPEQDRISHDLLLHVLDQRIADYGLKEYEMPLSQMDGIHLHLADLARAVPLDTVQQYEDYVARLRQIPRALKQTIQVLRQGERDRLMPVRFLLEKVPGQCDDIISEDPFLDPLKKFPATIAISDQRRLSEEVSQAVNTDVLPAYRQFANFVRQEYAPTGRTTLGLSSLPDGIRRYQNAIREQTTTDMTPSQIHALGLSEVARINGLLLELARREGYQDIFSYRASLVSNPKYIPKSPEQIVDDFRRYIAEMQSRLPELFGVIPKKPLTVEAAPSSQSGNASHYIPGTPDGRRSARVVVMTSNFAQRTLLGDETISYHEGIPGHHLQISIQQQLTGLPDFRLHIINSAYAEGWAVYAEALGKEIGFFQDPASDYGRLSTELMRAARLVVDTGIHSDGWSRDQAVEYFRQNGVADGPTIQAEIDRYISWPAQALSYKIGQLKIRELRERAKSQLASRFDIRSFHDEVLSGGSLPLNMLDQRINKWIAMQTQLGEGKRDAGR
jgi:uncharacterized protein (DUF885 family)